MNITLPIVALTLLAAPALAQDGHDHDQPPATPPASAPEAAPAAALEPTTEDMLIPAITFDADASNEVRVARSANGLILFPATINGQDLGWWMLDTGTNQNVIDVRAAREAGLAEAGAVITKDFNGIEQSSPTFAGFSLKTGNITIDQPRVVGVSTIPIASSVVTCEAEGFFEQGNGHHRLPQVHQVLCDEGKRVKPAATLLLLCALEGGGHALLLQPVHARVP